MKLLSFLVLVSLTIACSEEKNVNTNVCTSTEQANEVAWFAELKSSITNCSCEVSIIKGSYQGETVIFIALTDPLCDGIDTPTLYNCVGKKIRTFTNSAADQKDLQDNVIRESILYTCQQ